MSIVTKSGDAGTTGLMYNRRVAKSHPRIEACGCVDELNAAIGLARATAKHDFIRDHLITIQRDLVTLMGELATAPEDLPRYVGDGFTLVTPEFTAKLDAMVKTVEAQNISYHGWAMPGAELSSAAMEMARTVCRRAERQVSALPEEPPLKNPEIMAFLNRLSDLLWLLARWQETQSAAEAASTCA
jgi:cob(I)alamin adenosyltransferase